MRIGILDYGVGNLRSVANAFKAIGASVEITKEPTTDKLVLPGVGAFGEAMAKLGPLRHALDAYSGKVLGLCLGMQLMADKSFEHGEHQGLGWIHGEVHPLPEPHVGWSSTELGTFYFVHGYHFIPRDDVVIARAGDIVAAVQRGRFMGTQFHPEKSQKDGLKLLERFVQW